MQKATLNLFNAIQVDSKKTTKKLLLEKTIKDGYILSPAVAAIADNKLLKTISSVVGISGTKANNSFHKSWKIVQDTPMEELVVQQIIHYITTYGFEDLGIYKEDAIYIPAEELKIPKIKDSIKLIVIKGLTKEEVLEKIIELGGSGIALKDETLKDILTIVEGNDYDSKFVEEIKNRELKSKLYDLYGIVPSDPLEFLRYVINKVSGESLLIKNSYLINKIKESNSDLHIKTLDRLLKKAPKNLASIFFRYKPLFLALKTISKNKKFFNHLRKDADELHKPMSEDFLNSVTSHLKKDGKVSANTLKDELEKVNIFRKIRLAYALKFRTKENDAIVYRIRNGKVFATDFDFNQQVVAERVLQIVLDSIKNDLKVKDKIIYIPNHINYALPATEKQFTGNFPTGTYVSVPKDMVVGIHWEDIDHNIIDLDLSTINASGKIGWDSNYRSDNGNVLFSGDMTAAPKPLGATELFYIKQGDTDEKIMYVNYFNYSNDIKVPAKIIVAHDVPRNFGRDYYVVNPNNIIAQANIEVNKHEHVLGLITKVGKEQRFYFATFAMGNSVTAHGDHNEMVREYLKNSLIDTIDFRELLEEAGAKVVDQKPVKGKFIDLSPETLDKTTIINLINGNI